ncbi:MAG: SLC13 family permease [Chromatocurvus sp.]
MTTQQILIIAILLATVGMFLWGRWRHDMVALGSLLACVTTGLVEPSVAFSGFGHPAVITVACVLVLSRGLQASGAVDALARVALPGDAGPLASLAAIVALGAVLSGFMNNVGAMALLMPVALQIARQHELPPGKVLMPLAFGTILGGMTTMIGTPPNLIVSGFRAESGGNSFGMFDFTPVGLTVAVIGTLFVVLLGRRLVPDREQHAAQDFATGAYLTEARVRDDGKAAGMTLREVESTLGEGGAQIIGLVRNEVRLAAPHPGRELLSGDVLIMEADVEALAELLSKLGLELEATATPDEANGEANDETDREDESEDDARDRKRGREELVLGELAVMPLSTLAGRSAADLQLAARYNLSLLAVSREGASARKRLRNMALLPGDLLLMQGSTESIAEFAADNGCVPLARRELRIPDKRKAWIAGLVMAGAVAGAAFGLLPAAISFAMGVLASMALNTVPPRNVYSAIDWPVIVLLGALIPVAEAMAATGTADLIATFLLTTLAQGNAIAVLTLILVVTMFLSDLMNNAATAAVMCPIAIGTASALGVNPDSFLMAVAIGASCAFLTPIGHQNNTLILGPGGFNFSDFWRLGLPLEILVVLISIPMLLLAWPL